MTIVNENSIRRYNANGQPLTSATLPTFLGERNVMQHVEYSRSGQYVMASAPGRRPLVWQDSDFNRIAILGESTQVSSYAATFAPDSKFILQLDRADDRTSNNPPPSSAPGRLPIEEGHKGHRGAKATKGVLPDNQEELRRC